MKPGITQLTRMLCGASSLASTLENRISADFAGPVQEDRNGGLSVMIPVWPLTLTIRSPPWANHHPQSRVVRESAQQLATLSKKDCGIDPSHLSIQSSRLYRSKRRELDFDFV
jgi:hypothetical protein